VQLYSSTMIEMIRRHAMFFEIAPTTEGERGYLVQYVQRIKQQVPSGDKSKVTRGARKSNSVCVWSEFQTPHSRVGTNHRKANRHWAFSINPGIHLNFPFRASSFLRFGASVACYSRCTYSLYTQHVVMSGEKMSAVCLRSISYKRARAICSP
jgi:hypothetical protein